MVHTYAELWHASYCVLDVGIKNPSGSVFQFLSSLILTAFAFEAYMNHVGPRTIQSWGQLERLPPWAKFQLLCEVLRVKFAKGNGERPLQTITKLFEFRNTIAHGRSVKITPKPEERYIDETGSYYVGEKALADWERLIRTDFFAKRAREDVEVVLKLVHAARIDAKEGLFTLGLGRRTAKLVRDP